AWRSGYCTAPPPPRHSFPTRRSSDLHATGGVLLPELHDGVRPLARARVLEADGLHRPEARRVVAAPGDLLDRHAALEELEVLPVARHVPSRLAEGGVEPVVLLLREGQVDVVGLLAVAAG